MNILYDLAFLAIAIFYLPIYLFKRKFHGGFAGRLGFLAAWPVSDRPIWIHAVSVGEALAVKGLVNALHKAYPKKKLFITTVTATGNKIVKGFAGENDLVAYLPLDFSFITARVVKKIDPCLMVIAETELWPNLILSLHKKGIPVLIVNGRISDRSFRGYMMIKNLLKPVLDKITLFCVQSLRDAERLIQMGVNKDKVRVTGNMKFDIIGDSVVEDHGLKERMGVKAGEKILVAGSTHPGEEEIILNAYKGLLRRLPGLKLLFAPRHPERATAVEKIIAARGFRTLRISQLEAGVASDGHAVFILDAIGKLVPFYQIADIVFVGGSLIKKGGHNILEPAALGKPVISGPYLFNFRDIADLFLNNDACILVRDARELESAAAGLLNDSLKAQALVEKAKVLIAQNRGATLKNLECAKELIKC
jgi:3-deoxy-D-manno-octulosonic-acid transferase